MTEEAFMKYMEDQIAFWNKAFSQVTDDMEKSYINGRLSTMHDIQSMLITLVITKKTS